MERSSFISVDFGCIIMKNLTDLICTVISTRMKQPKLVETRHLMHDRRLWSVFRNSKLNKLFWHPCKTYEYRKAISPILSASSIDTEFCQSNFDGAKKKLNYGNATANRFSFGDNLVCLKFGPVSPTAC